MEVRTARQAVQLARRLGRRKAREIEQRFVIEGITFVDEALSSASAVECLVYTERMPLHRKGQALLNRAREQGVPAFQVDEQTYEELSDTETPQGVLAVAQKPVWRQTELLQRPAGLFLALDGLQDPGNLGAILRTGDGAGVDGVWMGQGTVDLYNPKVLRATMGSVFRLPAFAGVDLPLLLPELKAVGMRVVAAVPHAGQSYFQADLKHRRLLLLIGNEALGISRSLLALADQTVSIPLRPVVESLNAAVAAALLIYEVRRQQLEGV
jgi:TrmH family RNA methyltransferase